MLKNNAKVSYLTGTHYKHIHTIKNSSNKLEQLPETRKQA